MHYRVLAMEFGSVSYAKKTSERLTPLYWKYFRSTASWLLLFDYAYFLVTNTFSSLLLSTVVGANLLILYAFILDWTFLFSSHCRSTYDN